MIKEVLVIHRHLQAYTLENIDFYKVIHRVIHRISKLSTG